MPSWAPAISRSSSPTPSRSSNKGAVTTAEVRDELQAFAHGYLREELSSLSATLTAQVRAMLEDMFDSNRVTSKATCSGAAPHLSSNVSWEAAQRFYNKASGSNVSSESAMAASSTMNHIESDDQWKSEVSDDDFGVMPSGQPFTGMDSRFSMAMEPSTGDMRDSKRVGARKSYIASEEFLKVPMKRGQGGSASEVVRTRHGPQLKEVDKQLETICDIDQLSADDDDDGAAVLAQSARGEGIDYASYFPIPTESTRESTLFEYTEDSARLLLAEADSNEDRLYRQFSHLGSFWESGVSTRLALVVTSPAFDNVVAFAIFCNLVLICVETDYMAKNEVLVCPTDFAFFDDLFCALFSVEIAIRMCVYGESYFTMPTWKWNIFDCIIMFFQLVDVVIRFFIQFEGWQKVSMEHVFSYVRLFRVARAVRIVHMMKDLRLLSHSIVESMKPLGWTVCLLALMTFMFSIFLTMVVTNHRLSVMDETGKSQLSEEQDASLKRYYGSIERSTLSLYEMISDGIHWGELVEPLRQISPWLELLFAAYVALSVLAMMNIVMGIFVDSVMRTTDNTKKRELIHKMKRLFEDADADGSGTIDWEEFEGQLSNPDMQGLLKDIDLDEEGAHDLFNLLDVEDLDEVSAADFVSGCARLSGAAKAMDLAVIQHEQRMFHGRFDKHVDLVERSLSWQTDTLATVLLLSKPPAEDEKKERKIRAEKSAPIRIRRASCSIDD